MRASERYFLNDKHWTPQRLSLSPALHVWSDSQHWPVAVVYIATLDEGAKLTAG